jgi:hypothetical protein
MRDDLDAAMSDIDEGEVKEEVIEVAAPEEATTQIDETPAPEEETTALEDKTPQEPTQETPQEAKDDKTKSLKAPAGWSPKDRENWSKVPPELQQRINAREQEMIDTMANTSASRQVHERMTQLVNSYAPVMAAEGVNDPIEAAEGMFKTVAQLRMGTAQQKAQTIAQMINHYGVDITSLDNALVGNEQPTTTQTSDVEQRVAEQMQPFNKVMETLQQLTDQKTEQSKASAISSVQQFADTAEFLNDVRNPMADLIDAAAARGQDLSLEKAYNMACMLDPEISAVLDQRKQDAALLGSNNNLANKRRAASSLNGRQSGIATHQGGVNRRSDLLQAWDDATG